MDKAHSSYNGLMMQFNRINVQVRWQHDIVVFNLHGCIGYKNTIC